MSCVIEIFRIYQCQLLWSGSSLCKSLSKFSFICIGIIVTSDQLFVNGVKSSYAILLIYRLRFLKYTIGSFADEKKILEFILSTFKTQENITTGHSRKTRGRICCCHSVFCIHSTFYYIADACNFRVLWFSCHIFNGVMTGHSSE